MIDMFKDVLQHVMECEFEGTIGYEKSSRQSGRRNYLQLDRIQRKVEQNLFVLRKKP